MKVKLLKQCGKELDVLQFIRPNYELYLRELALNSLGTLSELLIHVETKLGVLHATVEVSYRHIKYTEHNYEVLP